MRMVVLSTLRSPASNIHCSESFYNPLSELCYKPDAYIEQITLMVIVN